MPEPPDGAVVEGVVVDGVVVVEGVVVVVPPPTVVPPSVVVEGVVVVAAGVVVVAVPPVVAAYALVPPISAPAIDIIASPFRMCVFIACSFVVCSRRSQRGSCRSSVSGSWEIARGHSQELRARLSPIAQGWLGSSDL
jgi:hypothetical protein